MYYLNDVGVLSTLGKSKQDTVATLLTRGECVPKQENLLSALWGHQVGRVHLDLPPLPISLSRFDCWNNRLAAAAIEQIRPAIEKAIGSYGVSRIGVVMGTSTTGIASTEDAVRSLLLDGEYLPGYHPIRGALGGLGEFVAAYMGIMGPVSTVSTACSSSGNALLSARRLLRLGVCDAVVVGGVDSLCKLTLQGFGALGALASGYCKPLGASRDGINIGEAAAIFLMSRDVSAVGFLGGAASSDAHHISAPHPQGEGAFRAMQGALKDAGLHAVDIDYLNLHGTGTPQNDSMECLAVNRLLGDSTPCSSTKSMTGHTLGAASALELALCWLLLNCEDTWRLPPSLHLPEIDPHLAPVRLTEADDYEGSRPRVCMSNSFAFGGSNVSLVIGSIDE